MPHENLGQMRSLSEQISRRQELPIDFGSGQSVRDIWALVSPTPVQEHAARTFTTHSAGQATSVADGIRHVPGAWEPREFDIDREGEDLGPRRDNVMAALHLACGTSVTRGRKGNAEPH